MKRRSHKDLGYTMLDPGDAHRCKLPNANRFHPGAVVRCDGCGRTYDWALGLDNYWRERE